MTNLATVDPIFGYTPGELILGAIVLIIVFVGIRFIWNTFK